MIVYNNSSCVNGIEIFSMDARESTECTPFCVLHLSYVFFL